MYSLIPTQREELKLLELTTTKKTDGDYINFDKNEVILDLHNPKTKHDDISFDITKESPHLAQLITTSYKMLPRKYVFTYYVDIYEKENSESFKKIY